MNWLLDIIVLAIIGITVFFAVKNGFIKTLISTISFALCILVTVLFVSPLSNALQNTGIAEKVNHTTAENISHYIFDGSLGGVEDLLDGKSEGFNTLLKIAGTDNEAVKSWYAQNVGSGDDGSYKLAEKISSPIVKALCTLIAVLILFFGTKLILFFVTRLLDGFAQLPVLKSFNKLFGVLLGIALAVVRVALFCFIVKVLTENSDFLNVDFIKQLDPDKTLIFRFFYGFDLFGFLKSLVN
ncbi:MAG: CvpA family protein [Clostridia bacterium]|nr:CvpA family protein [Clostridia bacterium]